MIAWLRSLFTKGVRDASSDAFRLGQQAGEAITEDALKTTDYLLEARRLNFIAVLDGRLSAINGVPGISCYEQAQIELKVMLENWSERMSDQKAEVWDIVTRRWPHELVTSAPDELRDIIKSRVDWHYSQLIAEGLEHAADAVAVHNGGVALGRD